MTNYVLNVGMTCGGCSGAVTRLIGKLDNVTLVSADVETKKVTVSSALNEEECKAAVMGALTKWSQSAGKSLEWVGSA